MRLLRSYPVLTSLPTLQQTAQPPPSHASAGSHSGRRTSARKVFPWPPFLFPDNPLLSIPSKNMPSANVSELDSEFLFRLPPPTDASAIGLSIRFSQRTNGRPNSNTSSPLALQR